jgi:chemotaxis methyl-accepting protein methylase
VVVAWSAGCASGEEAYTLAMVFGRNDLIQGALPG